MAKVSFNAQMATRFKKITSDYGKINSYVHETAMMILRHSHDHNDCSTAQRLVNAMPQSARKLALVTWFTKFSPVVVKDDDNWQSKMHKEGTKLYVPFDIEAAELTPWYTIAKEMGAEKPAANVEVILAWLASQATQWEKKADDDSKIEPGAALAAKSLAAQLRAIKLAVAAPANVNEVPALQEVAA